MIHYYRRDASTILHTPTNSTKTFAERASDMPHMHTRNSGVPGITISYMLTNRQPDNSLITRWKNNRDRTEGVLASNVPIFTHIHTHYTYTHTHKLSRSHTQITDCCKSRSTTYSPSPFYLNSPPIPQCLCVNRALS